MCLFQLMKNKSLYNEKYLNKINNAYKQKRRKNRCVEKLFVAHIFAN